MQENDREFSPLKMRILQYLDEKGITKYECYKNTKITNGILSQKNGLSEENMLKFLTYYADVSLEWLFTGEGKMLTSQRYDSTPFASCAGEETAKYGRKRGKETSPGNAENEKVALLQAIRRMTEVADRNSVSLARMVEAADVNTRMLEKLIDRLIGQDPKAVS